MKNIIMIMSKKNINQVWWNTFRKRLSVSLYGDNFNQIIIYKTKTELNKFYINQWTSIP